MVYLKKTLKKLGSNFRNNLVYKKRKFYPNFKQAVFVLFIAVVLSGMFSVGLGVLFKGSKNLGITLFLTTLPSLVMFLVLYIFVKDKHKKVFLGMFSKNVDFNFLYTIIPMIAGTMLLNIFFNYFIPASKDNMYNEFMMKIATDKSIIIFFMIPIAIIAPITEELIFRGMILKGIASNHNATMAIFLSAFLFSIIHLNLAQIPNAFILGIIFAFIMLHTKNIFYTIIYHAINNFFVTFMLFFVKPEDLNRTDEIPKDTSSPFGIIILAVVGVFLIYVGLKWTIKTITKEDRTVIPSQQVYNNYLAALDNNELD